MSLMVFDDSKIEEIKSRNQKQKDKEVTIATTEKSQEIKNLELSKTSEEELLQIEEEAIYGFNQ